jgi:hypothetical protein
MNVRARELRWFHEGVDRLYIAFMSRLIPPVFRNGSTSPPLRDHVAAVEVQLPTLVGDQRYALTAGTMVGGLPAGFRVRLGSRRELPVLIYHHGLGEIPYDQTFRRIFPRRTPIDAHLVVVRAPFHGSYIDCSRGLATLSQFMAMCAVSVTLIEAVRLAFVERGARGCVVAGISLGGFVALLHHLTYGSASCYAPQLAGPDLAHTLLSTPCRRFLQAQVGAQPGDLPARLDFRAAFRASDTQHILPLLGRYDLWMPFAYHDAEYSARGVPVTPIDRGHMTGSWAFSALRAHLLAGLRLASGKSG